MQIEIMVIGGTEAYNLASTGLGTMQDDLLVDTPWGPSGRVQILSVRGRAIGFMSRHGEHRHDISAPFVNYRANIWAAKELGAQRVISWNSTGSVNRLLQPGDYVIIDDYVDATRHRTYTFYEGKGYGFVRQNPAFCPEVRAVLYEAARAVEPRTFDVGTYVCTEGPRLETPAEIRIYATWGADVVGMTVVPEVLLAKELEMCYASLTYVLNFAEGTRPTIQDVDSTHSPLLPPDFVARVKVSAQRLPEIISHAIALLPRERKCECQYSMRKHRERGDIGEDWHEWTARK